MERKLFLFQKHSSEKHHYDLRIEGDGVALSWVLYKEFPETLLLKRRLAIRMPSHPLKFLEEGGDKDPRKETLLKGTCKLIKFDERERIVFRLRANTKDNRQVTGIYALFKWRGSKWLLNKIKEEGNENIKSNVGEVENGRP